jgi:hypothetical protein
VFFRYLSEIIVSREQRVAIDNGYFGDQRIVSIVQLAFVQCIQLGLQILVSGAVAQLPVTQARDIEHEGTLPVVVSIPSTTHTVRELNVRSSSSSRAGALIFHQILRCPE